MARKRHNPITLRNLPPPLAEAVREHAARYRVSLNKAVIQLLDDRLTASPEGIRHDDLDHLAGSWSSGEAARARRRLGKIRRIDQEMWR